MYAHHKSKSQDWQHQCSPLLFSFIRKGKFNWENLDQTNSYGVTPLTEAVSSNEETVILELLKLGVNPIIENIHGNTPLSLSQQKPQFLKIIEQAIEHRICEVLMCKIDTEFYYNNKTYRIKKILKGGSCSLAVIEIENNHTLEQYFAKIKPYFGGLEIRNYIFLEQYIDLFIIKNLMLYSNEQKNSRIIKNVYCLVQKQEYNKPW